ncbi:MAG TPA: hypothetical protein VK559_07835 [Ferruginibacter sp.]|nr:hypothetical protein [Ferruginibacter sp.]
MKSLLKLFFIIALSFSSLGCRETNHIDNCYISFTTASNLTAASPDRLPDDGDKFWTVTTYNGETKVSRIDGYRVLYYNSYNAPFVNLKVELSDDSSYETDKKNILDNLTYLNKNSPGMESKDLIKLDLNGYSVFGLSRSNLDQGHTIGSFAFFPGNGIIVYFDFNTLTATTRNFKDIKEYKKQRNQFIDEYTKYLRICLAN